MNIPPEILDRLAAVGNNYIAAKSVPDLENDDALSFLVEQFSISKEPSRGGVTTGSFLQRDIDNIVEADERRRPRALVSAYKHIAKFCSSQFETHHRISTLTDIWRKVREFGPPPDRWTYTVGSKGFIVPHFEEQLRNGVAPEKLRAPSGARPGIPLVNAIILGNNDAIARFAKTTDNIEPAVRLLLDTNNPELLDFMLSNVPSRVIEKCQGVTPGSFELWDVAIEKHGLRPAEPDQFAALAVKLGRDDLWESFFASGQVLGRCALDTALEKKDCSKVCAVVEREREAEVKKYYMRRAFNVACASLDESFVMGLVRATPFKTLFHADEATHPKELESASAFIAKHPHHFQEMFDMGAPIGIIPHARDGNQVDSHFAFECARKYLQRDKTLSDDGWDFVLSLAPSRNEGEPSAAPVAALIDDVSALSRGAFEKISSHISDDKTFRDAVNKTNLKGAQIPLFVVAGFQEMAFTEMVVSAGGRFGGDLSDLSGHNFSPEHLRFICQNLVPGNPPESHSFRKPIRDGDWPVIRAMVEAGGAPSWYDIADIRTTEKEIDLDVFKQMVDAAFPEDGLASLTALSSQIEHLFNNKDVCHAGEKVLRPGLLFSEESLCSLVGFGRADLAASLFKDISSRNGKLPSVLAKAGEYDKLKDFLSLYPDAKTFSLGPGQTIDPSVPVEGKRKLLALGMSVFYTDASRAPCVPDDKELIALVLTEFPDKANAIVRGKILRSECALSNSKILPLLVPLPDKGIGRGTHLAKLYEEGGLSLVQLRERLAALKGMTLNGGSVAHLHCNERGEPFALKGMSLKTGTADIHDALKKLAGEDRKFSGESLRDYIIRRGDGQYRWTATLRQKPPFEPLASLSPFGFSQKAFSQILGAAVLEAVHNGERVDSAIIPAFNLTVLYGNATEAFKATRKRMGFGLSSTPLHDMGQFVLPKNGVWDIPKWRSMLNHHSGAGREVLGQAFHIEKYLGRVPVTLVEARETAAKIVYSNADENPQLATLLHSLNVSQEMFNEYLQLSRKQKTSEACPSVKIDGGEFGRPELFFERLPTGANEGPALGLITRCCQHLDGVASDAAEHGHKSPNGAFYVLRHKTDNRILAQTWAWRGKADELVFDSWEPIGPEYGALGTVVLPAAAERIVGRLGVTRVLAGTGGRTPDFPEITDRPAKPVDYSGYRDSSSQYLLVDGGSLPGRRGANRDLGSDSELSVR